jgi:hypothetical protein
VELHWRQTDGFWRSNMGRDETTEAGRTELKRFYRRCKMGKILTDPNTKSSFWDGRTSNAGNGKTGILPNDNGLNQRFDRIAPKHRF